LLTPLLFPELDGGELRLALGLDLGDGLVEALHGLPHYPICINPANSCHGQDGEENGESDLDGEARGAFGLAKGRIFLIAHATPFAKPLPTERRRLITIFYFLLHTDYRYNLPDKTMPAALLGYPFSVRQYFLFGF